MEGIRRQFDTNVIGLLETTKAVLPHFRAQKSGVIVNISSVGGKMTFPLGTLYHGTKFAVEGLSEALHYELEPLGIKVKIVEPGVIATDFLVRSFECAQFVAVGKVGALPAAGVSLLLTALTYLAERRASFTLAHVPAAQLHESSENLVCITVVLEYLEVVLLCKRTCHTVELRLAQLDAKVT